MKLLSSFQFSDQIQKTLDTFFAKAKQSGVSRKIAVFDADGTLWHDDVGDIFLTQGFSRSVFPKEASLAEYEKLYEQSPASAYELLVKWLDGKQESFIWETCHKILKDHSPKPFDGQQALVKKLKEEGFEIWVISASPWWMVVAAAQEYYGVPPERVLAARTKVDAQGILFSNMLYDVPFRETKVTALQRFVCAQPHMVAGNSMGDWSLLHQSLWLSLVIHGQNPSEPYFDSEVKLLEKVQSHYPNEVLAGEDVSVVKSMLHTLKTKILGTEHDTENSTSFQFQGSAARVWLLQDWVKN